MPSVGHGPRSRRSVRGQHLVYRDIESQSPPSLLIRQQTWHLFSGLKSRLNILANVNNEKTSRLFIAIMFSSSLIFLMNVGIGLQAWPTHTRLAGPQTKKKKLPAIVPTHRYQREGLDLHMRIRTHAQWWISQFVHPHRWSLCFVSPLCLVHSKHADAASVLLLVIC